MTETGHSNESQIIDREFEERERERNVGLDSILKNLNPYSTLWKLAHSYQPGAVVGGITLSAQSNDPGSSSP